MEASSSGEEKQRVLVRYLLVLQAEGENRSSDTHHLRCALLDRVGSCASNQAAHPFPKHAHLDRMEPT